MNRNEVKDVFKLLTQVYPQFEVTADKLDTWTRLLNDQNPAVVMRNAERYVLENKFPPSLSELRVIKKEAHSNDFLNQIVEWESEAVGYEPRS